MNIEIANRLVELRKKAGLSQEELANKLGISRQSVSKWERAEASPDTDNLICLAQIYKVSLDDILKTDESIEEIAESAKKRTEADEVKITKDNNTVIINSQGTIKISAKEQKRRDIRHWFNRFPFPVVVACAYLVLGFVCNAWGTGWLVFFTIPLYYTLIDAIYKRKPGDFAWPVLVAGVYLYLGMLYGMWHPWWIMFITVPIYYAITTPIHKHKRDDNATVTINGEHVIIDGKEVENATKKSVEDAVKDIAKSFKDQKNFHININGDDIVIDGDQDEDDIEDDIEEKVEDATRQHKHVEINIGGRHIVIDKDKDDDEGDEDDD